MDGKKDSGEVKREEVSLDKISKDGKELSGMKKTFSRRRGVLRIILGFIAILLWIFIGVSLPSFSVQVYRNL